MDNLYEIRSFLHGCLRMYTSESALSWLEQQQNKIAATLKDTLFFTTFSRLPQRVGKQDLSLTETEHQCAQRLHKGWVLDHWSIDQVARSWLLLSLPWERETERSQRWLQLAFNHGDVAELVALYQSLPLLPFPEQHIHRAAEGIRSNMTAVFNAVALGNPYPAEYLDDIAWNQLVVKALFVGTPLHPIQGFDRRVNPKLTQMLTDYAHERWAAGRAVQPELWRGVAPFATASHRADFQRLLSSADPLERDAGTLACITTPEPVLRELLQDDAMHQQRFESGQLSWKTLYHAIGVVNHSVETASAA